MVIELEIERVAPFIGKEVRMLGLPAGVGLIRCIEAGRELSLIASTCIDAHTRITAVIAPEAADGLASLRRGCQR